MQPDNIQGEFKVRMMQLLMLLALSALRELLPMVPVLPSQEASPLQEL
jgi:hypothetical protein